LGGCREREAAGHFVLRRLQGRGFEGRARALPQRPHVLQQLLVHKAIAEQESCILDIAAKPVGRGAEVLSRVAPNGGHESLELAVVRRILAVDEEEAIHCDA
jgi:hypothetical protein